jgi:hypothetical protein
MIWNTKIIALTATSILLAGSAVYAYNKGRQSGMQEVQILWDSERLVTAQAHAEQQMKARQTEQALQKLVDQQRQEHRREVNRIVSRYNADIERLRDRPEARATDSGVPEGAVAGVGCTGAGLSKSDAEFLSWYSASAARTQAALDACIHAYNEVRESINARD